MQPESSVFQHCDLIIVAGYGCGDPSSSLEYAEIAGSHAVQRLEMKINTTAPARAVAQRMIVVRFPQRSKPVSTKPGTGAMQSRRAIKAMTSMIVASAIQVHGSSWKHHRLAYFVSSAGDQPTFIRLSAIECNAAGAYRLSCTALYAHAHEDRGADS